MSRKRLVLEILNGIVFAIAILGLNLFTLLNLQLPPWLQITLSVLLVAVYVYAAIEKSSKRTRKFVEGSPKFVKYFESWYAQEGTLSLFCTDLNWLNNAQSAGIVFQLQSKRNNLKLYLREPYGRVAEQLALYGARRFRIKDNIVTQHRLSVLEQNGECKIIVRNKQLETNNVEFVETDLSRDPYLVGLVKDLLDDCYEYEIE